MSYFLLIIN